MNSFDVSKLSSEDLVELNDAVGRVAPKIRFWYVALDSGKLDLESVAEQTQAVSDFDKLKNVNKGLDEDGHFEKVGLGRTREIKSFWKRFVGHKDRQFCVFNPENLLVEVNVGRHKTAKLDCIVGLGFGNTFDARVDFDDGLAFLAEEDQDIAHRLGLMYTPAKVYESDSFCSSDFELHKEKPKFDDAGNTLLYCDNIACCERVRNPILVIDRGTGGLYHSRACYMKDMRIKAYLIRERDGTEISPNPERVPIDEALKMYEKGDLQQSPNTNKKDKLREIKAWPEGAIVIPF